MADFAALVAQSIVNAQARQEATALAEEQAALRRVATLVAAGRPQEEVVEAVTQEAANLFEAENVSLMRWEGVQDEVVVVGGWSQGGDSMIEAGSLYSSGSRQPYIACPRDWLCDARGRALGGAGSSLCDLGASDRQRPTVGRLDARSGRDRPLWSE